MAGYRACKRCRPESAPGTPAWKGTLAHVSRALKLITQSSPKSLKINQLANRLGTSDRHLRRLFARHVGLSPQAVIMNNKLNTAQKLICQTSEPLSKIAFTAGFNSIRRFNDAIKKRFGLSPTKLRSQKEGNTTS
ncbi:MAG: helix-turn-helix domain-containing protein [Oligoflexia bacterium]|nr:helix-turn-helix domain-containing protein [Oligoflexia bacterium]